MIDVPEVVRNKAVAVGASAWLEDSPAIVAELERGPEITVGRTFGDATEAFVAEAVVGDGTRVVLKSLCPAGSSGSPRDHRPSSHCR